MRSGPEKVYRETCAHCQWQGMPEECADCPTKIAYDYIDERNARIYYTEVRHLEECADCPTKIAYDYIDERNARIYYTEVRHLHENFRSSYLRRMCMDIKGGRARGKV